MQCQIVRKLYLFYNANVNIAISSWGDNTRQSGETCDDGNLDDGDGWSYQCIIEAGAVCYDPGSSISDIWDIWGDGKRPQPTGCDDGIYNIYIELMIFMIKLLNNVRH